MLPVAQNPVYAHIEMMLNIPTDKALELLSSQIDVLFRRIVATTPEIVSLSRDYLTPDRIAKYNETILHSFNYACGYTCGQGDVFSPVSLLGKIGARASNELSKDETAYLYIYKDFNLSQLLLESEKPSHFLDLINKVKSIQNSAIRFNEYFCLVLRFQQTITFMKDLVLRIRETLINPSPREKEEKLFTIFYENYLKEVWPVLAIVSTAIPCEPHRKESLNSLGVALLGEFPDDKDTITKLLDLSSDFNNLRYDSDDENHPINACEARKEALPLIQFTLVDDEKRNE